MKALILFTLAIASAAGAAPGHDHGDAAPAGKGQVHPRMSAHSDLFELTGVLEKGQMTVYLDRYATNEPVTNARIEFESGSEKGEAAPQADGTYLIQLAALSGTGDVPFAFTVTAGADTDLLAADLSLGEAHSHEEGHASGWRRDAAWAAALLAALAAVFIAFRSRAARRTRIGT